jgi:hypothetical protein
MGLGLKRKPLISFSRKARISKNSLVLCEISRNFVLRKFALSRKFPFLRKISRKNLFLREFSRKVFVFCESFCENFRFRPCFCKYFRVLEAFRQKRNYFKWFLVTSACVSDLDIHSVSSWIRISIPNGKFSRNFSRKRKFSFQPCMGSVKTVNSPQLLNNTVLQYSTIPLFFSIILVINP